MRRERFIVCGLAAALALVLLPETSLAQRLRGRIGAVVRGRPAPTVYYYVRPGPVDYPPSSYRAWYYGPYNDYAPADAEDARPGYTGERILMGDAVRPVANSTSRETGTSATINLQVPAADAEVWVQGKKLEGSGTRRRFVSPPLETGDKYTYVFQGRWLRDGLEVIDSRTVEVYSGDRVTVDFTRPAPAATSTEIVPREFREPRK